MTLETQNLQFSPETPQDTAPNDAHAELLWSEEGLIAQEGNDPLEKRRLMLSENKQRSEDYKDMVVNDMFVPNGAPIICFPEATVTECVLDKYGRPTTLQVSSKTCQNGSSHEGSQLRPAASRHSVACGTSEPNLLVLPNRSFVVLNTPMAEMHTHAPGITTGVVPTPTTGGSQHSGDHGGQHGGSGGHGHEPIPGHLIIRRPEANVKLLCHLWTLLMSLFGIAVKMFGYLRQDGGVDNKSYSLYTSFIQLLGVFSLLCLIFLQWAQKKVNRNNLMYDPHNGSFYLKAGLIGFTVGTLVYNLLQLIEDFDLFFEHSDCANFEYSAFHMISLSYNILQCLTLFLFSKVTFTYLPNLALWCLAHLIAVCLHSWFSFVADEFAESLHWEEHIRSSENLTECAKILEESEVANAAKSAAVFLFPMSIELYLIAGGFFTIMFHNVGRPQVVKDSKQSVVYGALHKQEWNSHFFMAQTGYGFLFGVALVVVTGIIVALKEMYSEQFKILPVAFHWFIFFVNALMLVCTYKAYTYLKKREIHKHFHNRIDAPLLVVALSGMCMYALFSIFAGVNAISHIDHDPADAIGTFAGYFSHFFQSVVQTCFLFDVMRRQAGKLDNSRQMLLIILCGNIALWVTQMFELDFEEVNPMQITLYGHTNWTLITHIAGPLAIFFRFHSAACIFDVFHTSYREPKSKKHYYKSSTGSTHKVSTGSAHKMSTASAHKISTGSAGQGQPQGQFSNMTAVPIQTQQQQQIPIVPLQAAVAVPANQNHVFTANQLAMNYAVGEDDV